VWKPAELTDIHSDKFDFVLLKLLCVIVVDKSLTLYGLHGMKALVELFKGGLGGKQAINYIYFKTKIRLN
jgi:hypothetical protein